MENGDIRGNTTAVKNTASNIRDNAKAYGKAAESIFSTVDALKATWTSEDGNAYIAKISAYRPEFEALLKKLEASAEALEDAAISYEQALKANMQIN